MLIKSVSRYRHKELLERNVTSVRGTVVYVLTARRNAWHSTRISRYSSDEAIFTNAASARLAAEGRRKAGTYFVVAELPALVFDLHDISLVAVHLNVLPPFKTWKPPLNLSQRRATLSGSEVVEAFGSSHYRSKESGWRIHDGEPTVILGVVARGHCQRPLKRRFSVEVSYIESHRMYFRTARQSQISCSHIERIAGELGHLVKQPLRVHQLARELGVSSSYLRAMLEGHGHSAKVARSWLDAETVEEARSQWQLWTHAPES